MTNEERNSIIILIRQNLKPSRYRYIWSSYGLKEVFEKLSGQYISNTTFKELMEAAGFPPIPESRKDINHRYRIEVIPSPQIGKHFWGHGCQIKYLENG